MDKFYTKGIYVFLMLSALIINSSQESFGQGLFSYSGWPAGSSSYSVTPYTGYSATYSISNSGANSYISSTPDDYYYCAGANCNYGLYLAINWPDTSSFTTLTITLSTTVLGAYFTIYDIDAGGNSAPFSFQDRIIISATNHLGNAIVPGAQNTQQASSMTASTDNNNSNSISGNSIIITGSKTASSLTASSNTIWFGTNNYLKTVTLRYRTGGGSINGEAANNPVGQYILISPLIFSTVLPVKMTSFNLLAENRKARLQWSMSAENNQYHYTIERSSNGTDFEEIATMAVDRVNFGEYSYTDRNPAPGVNYYRIRYVNEHGQIKYSAIQSLSFKSTAEGGSIQPTVATDHTTLIVKNYTEVQSATLYNLNGNPIQTIRVNSSNTLISLHTLATGYYIVRIQYRDGRSENMRFIKQ